jgi:hypothetical protein
LALSQSRAANHIISSAQRAPTAVDHRYARSARFGQDLRDPAQDGILARRDRPEIDRPISLMSGAVA